MIPPIETKQKPKCWSPAPKESYGILYEGRWLAIADSPGLDLPGAWNILYLCTHELLDTLLNYSDDPGDFPVELAVTPAVVGTSLQNVDGKTLGEWALELSPAEWLEKAGRIRTVLVSAAI